MPDTITKILFRRGLDIQRRTAGGDGVKFNVGEPAFCLDTKRLYVGTGTDSNGLVGGTPIGIKNHGIFSSVLGSGLNGYNVTTYNTLTTNGIDVGDILFDNSPTNTVMYYVSSKNPLSAVPAISELVRYNLLARVSGDNGITAIKDAEVATYRLDRNYFDVIGSTITLKVNVQTNGNSNVAGSFNCTNGGIFGTTLDVGSNLNVAGNITSNSVIYSNGPAYTLGRSSDDWYSTYLTTRSTSAAWTSAARALDYYLPWAWQYSTATGVISTYATNYKVGINTQPTFQGLTIKGTSTTSTALSVFGSIEATGDVVVYSTSDIKYKKNVTPLENALDKVCQIRGVSFDWDKEGKSGKDVGVIAQEIEKVLPEAVINREDGKAVNYEKLIPLLIEAIKTLARK